MDYQQSSKQSIFPSGDLYPCIGLSHPNQRVSFIFDESKFAFDPEKRHIADDLDKISEPHWVQFKTEALVSKEDVRYLVTDYLRYIYVYKYIYIYIYRVLRIGWLQK